jgi:hypothetical protein
MKRPDITAGEWTVAYEAVWAGDGMSMLVDLDDPNDTTLADLHMMAAAPDMFDALNCIMAELSGRKIHLDNATRAIQAMHKAGGRFHDGGGVTP